MLIMTRVEIRTYFFIWKIYLSHLSLASASAVWELDINVCGMKDAATLYIIVLFCFYFNLL